MSVSAIIPAYQAADTIAETVRAVKTVPAVTEVIVVDDGSRDGTGPVAEQAGADRVIILPRNRGKGAALTAGVEVASGDLLLFLDADLGGSAAHAGQLVEAQRASQAMVVGVVRSSPGKGGFGLLRALARAAIRLLAGLEVMAPVSGQRALPAALVKHIGIAPRWAVEVGLTVEARHVGWPVLETSLPFEHRPTARTASGFLHRGGQFRDVLWLVLQIAYGIGWPALPRVRKALRLLVWAAGAAALLALTRAISRETLPFMAVAILLALAAWLPTLWLTAVLLRLRKANYLGRRLPSAAGLVVPLVALPVLSLTHPDGGLGAAAITVTAVMATVGLLDDLFGARHRARGLWEHLMALLHGRLTTGTLKALAGIGAGVAAGLMLHPGLPAQVALDALLIALAANLVNLFDMRPGRALKGFFLLAALALAAAPDSIRVLCPFLAAALILAPPDLAGRTMMGDVGANALGGVAGVALAYGLPVWARLAAVVALGALHVACEPSESVWLSDRLARNPVLRAVDRLGTGGLPPLPGDGG